MTVRSVVSSRRSLGLLSNGLLMAVIVLLAGCGSAATVATTTTTLTSTKSSSPTATRTLDIQACGALAADQQSAASGRVPSTDAGNFWKAVNAANGRNSQITQDAETWLNEVPSDANVYPTTAVAKDCTALGVTLYGLSPTTTTTSVSPYVSFSTIVGAVRQALQQGDIQGAAAIPDADVTCPPVTVAPGVYFACSIQSASVGSATFVGQINTPYPGGNYFDTIEVGSDICSSLNAAELATIRSLNFC